MTWHQLIMVGPIFDDRLYDSIGALVVFLVGAGIWFKTGNRLGWLFVIAAFIWAYLTYKDLLSM
jgi:hypothetical protein